MKQSPGIQEVLELRKRKARPLLMEREKRACGPHADIQGAGGWRGGLQSSRDYLPPPLGQLSVDSSPLPPQASPPHEQFRGFPQLFSRVWKAPLNIHKKRS